MSMAYPGLTHCSECGESLNGGIGRCESCRQAKYGGKNKYKVGDIVKLRDDLEDGNWYGTTRYAREMDFIKGKPMELTEKSKIFGDCYITKDENDVEWYISDEMIEGLWEECKPSEQVEKDNEHIEPEEPTEACEHEWERYSLGRLGHITENHKYCSKCGTDEIELEPTYNTKIEEINTEYLINQKAISGIITLIDKLNEVIRYINKGA